MKLIDLTHIITPGMPLFPGSEPVVIKRLAQHSSHGYQELYLTMTSHTGTHIDCPKHFSENGFDTATTLPDAYFGRGICIDCTKIPQGIKISKSILLPYEQQIRHHDFVIFHTGWSKHWGNPAYFSDFPVPDSEAAKLLRDCHIKGTGIDAISFDSMDSGNFDIHHILLESPMILIENLNQTELLTGKEFYFSCLPLKIESGDGSPVRAVAIFQE